MVQIDRYRINVITILLFLVRCSSVCGSGTAAVGICAVLVLKFFLKKRTVLRKFFLREKNIRGILMVEEIKKETLIIINTVDRK